MACYHGSVNKTTIAAPFPPHVYSFVLLGSIFFITSTGPVTPRPILQYWLPAKRKCDHNLRSNETHGGAQQTTLSPQSGRQGVGDGWRWIIDAQHTDHKQNTQAHAHTRCMQTNIYVRSIPHPIYSVVFFSVPSVIPWWQRQMEGSRGERLNSGRGEISLCLSLVWNKANSLCWPLLFCFALCVHPTLCNFGISLLMSPPLFSIIIIWKNVGNSNEFLVTVGRGRCLKTHFGDKKDAIEMEHSHIHQPLAPVTVTYCDCWDLFVSTQPQTECATVWRDTFGLLVWRYIILKSTPQIFYPFHYPFSPLQN